MCIRDSLSTALAGAWYRTATDRFVTIAGSDHLAADFNARSVGARVEGGHRFGVPAFGLTPYAAVQVQSLRTPGCAALGLAYAACGRFDVFCHPWLFPWDSAAGLLLVREGGGAVLNRAGAPATIFDRAVIAGGRAVAADLQRLWQGYVERGG